jgi:HSP20 family molecular chaperone IbpA
MKTNSLQKWNRHVDLFEQLGQKIFQDVWNDPFFGTTRNWRPQLYRETDKEYVVEIEVPRVKKTEVTCEAIEGSALLVSIDSPSIKYRQEFAFSDADNSAATAELKAGVLTVSIPKVNPPEPKRKLIEIKESD